MTDWRNQQLDDLAGTSEIEIAPRHTDGRLGRARTIWIVRVGDDLCIRSYLGPDGNWFRTITSTGQASIHASTGQYDVQLTAAPDVDRTAVDHAYRAKYGRSSYVTAMVSDAAAATTLRVTPSHEQDR
jgi:hypothetical protein